MSENYPVLTRINLQQGDSLVLCYCKTSKTYEVVKIRFYTEFEKTGYFSEDLQEAVTLLKKVAETQYPFTVYDCCYSMKNEIEYYCNFGLEWTLLYRG